MEENTKLFVSVLLSTIFSSFVAPIHEDIYNRKQRRSEINKNIASSMYGLS